MKDWIKKLRSTERGRTLFKFSLYMVFFTFVIVLVIVASVMGDPYSYNDFSSNSSIESTEEEMPELTYFEKQKALITGKYEFIYKITGNLNIQYEGVYDNGKVEGYKESEKDLLKYSIEEGKVYQINFGEKQEYDELYSGLDASIFDVEGLFMKLNMTSATIEKNGEFKTYNYENVELKDIKVLTNKNSILKIEVKEGETSYELSYKY